METEIICISSDDESDSQKENKTDKFPAKSAETSNGALSHGKVEISIIDNEKVEEKNLKRKIYTERKEITCNNMEKKKRLNVDQATSEVINKPELCSVPETQHTKFNCNSQPSKDQETIEKTQLIVKEKKKITYILEDVFPLFLTLCLNKCPKEDKADMGIIVDKLKRRYENLDPTYAKSNNFVKFLNEKREAITNDNKKIYVYIQEVMIEMKKKIKKESHTSQINEMYDAIPSTSYATNNVPFNTVELDNDDDNEYEENESRERKIKKVLRAMRQCEKVINRLEEEEVDFSDENNSNYIKSERFKRRIVELYNKLCELKGENADAGRVYLRPKHLKLTGIVVVDQAITNFINSKITRRNHIKKNRSLRDDLIFPDYRDILECVNRCNDKKKLGLDKRRCEQLAQRGFKELGEHLQRTRHNDYWDTFSLYLENTEDPAAKDTNLAKKLAENRTEGEKRLAAVFEKYTKKQAELRDQNNEGTTSEEENEDEVEDEEEEEEIEVEVEIENVTDEDKNEDILSVTSKKENSENEENIDKTVKENRLPIEKDKPNINMIKVCHATDEAVSNKTTTDTLPEKCNIVEIKVWKEINTADSKNENKIISEKIVHKPCNSNNTILRNMKSVVNTKTQEDLPAASTANCTKDLAGAKVKVVSKVVTDSVTKKVIKDVADTITSVDKPEEITQNVMNEAIEIMPDDEQLEEEKKPLLRVRSFAKPPTTWEDNQHKTDKTIQKDTLKVANQIKEIVDLTNEETTKSSVVTKCAVQLGNKVLPIMKRQTLVIPNVINVKNITNNYLKVNTRTGQIIAPVHDVQTGAATIIRLPTSVQTINRQIQPQNVNSVTNEIKPLKAQTILKIIPAKKVIIPKSAVQSVTKQTDVNSSTAQSK